MAPPLWSGPCLAAPRCAKESDGLAPSRRWFRGGALRAAVRGVRTTTLSLGLTGTTRHTRLWRSPPPTSRRGGGVPRAAQGSQSSSRQTASKHLSRAFAACEGAGAWGRGGVVCVSFGGAAGQKQASDSSISSAPPIQQRSLHAGSAGLCRAGQGTEGLKGAPAFVSGTPEITQRTAARENGRAERNAWNACVRTAGSIPSCGSAARRRKQARSATDAK